MQVWKGDKVRVQARKYKSSTYHVKNMEDLNKCHTIDRMSHSKIYFCPSITQNIQVQAHDLISFNPLPISQALLDT